MACEFVSSLQALSLLTCQYVKISPRRDKVAETNLTIKQSSTYHYSANTWSCSSMVRLSTGNVRRSYHVLGQECIGVILTNGCSDDLYGCPLILGLLWNKWAGGAAGFVMGGM